MKLKEIFGMNLRYYRKKRGLSQREVGDITGVHRVYISEIERGRKNITIDIMEAICIAMGIKISKMLKDRTAKDVVKDDEPDGEVVSTTADMSAPVCKMGKLGHSRNLLRHGRKRR